MIRSISRPLFSPVVAATLGGLLLAGALTALPAHAGTAPALQVKVGDLDLTHPAGVAILYRRLQFAAQQVCGPSVVTGSRIESSPQKACVKDAVDTAVRQIDRPALTAYHRSHAGQSDTARS
jgi:UrcA family protein